MTCTEFNEKYKDYLEEGHYGLDINIPSITEYLDLIFADIVKVIPEFKYSQIKLKFNSARCYTNLYQLGYKTLSRCIDNGIESQINYLVKEIDKKEKS